MTCRADCRAAFRLGVIVAATIAALSLVGHAGSAQTLATEDAWATLRVGGKVALIRHALAPGTGDPPGFVLEDCSTQRNLSAEGQLQAARLGEAFRANGVATDRVLSSGWCRCLETAVLAFGAAAVWAPLHSFFQDSSTGSTQTAATRAAMAAWTGPGTLVLVTHQVNITALTRIFPESGEIIVLEPQPSQPDGFSVIGRLTLP